MMAISCQQVLEDSIKRIIARYMTEEFPSPKIYVSKQS